MSATLAAGAQTRAARPVPRDAAPLSTGTRPGAVAAFIDGTTMHRLLLLYLAGLLAAGLGLSALGALPSSPGEIAATALLLAASCLAVQALLTRLLSVPRSFEPALITALILALIAHPVSPLREPGRAAALVFAGAVAIASKFLIAPGKQHVFNPAALGIYAAGMLFQEYSTWWVGNIALLPAVALGGALVLRKVGRARVVLVFLGAFALFLTVFSLSQGLSPGEAAAGVGFVFLQTELLFFAAVMLTDPVTSPKTFRLQAAHAVIVALLMLPQLSVLGVTFSPEAALLAGSLFSRLVSRNRRFVLRLRSRAPLASGIYEFDFERPDGLRFRPGQYMDWILSLPRADSRGNRRSLTLSSSPTERSLSFAVRIPRRPSAFKQALLNLRPGDTIVASELSGDFTLPPGGGRPVVLLAGGIGITPFRSMLRHLLDRHERRDITLIYSTYGPEEIAYRGDLEEARRELGVKVVYALADPRRVPDDWSGSVGLIDRAMIAREVPDPEASLFYVSGPPAMVRAVKASLRSLGVRRVRTDFFPGYALGAT